MLYSIYEIAYDHPKFIRGTCVTEGHNREEVIAKAEDYYRNKMIDNGERGRHSEDVLLVTYEEDADIETEDEILLTWTTKD